MICTTRNSSMAHRQQNGIELINNEKLRPTLHNAKNVKKVAENGEMDGNTVWTLAKGLELWW